MASKTSTYTYRVSIPISVNTKGLKDGTADADRELTRIERQAIKAQKQLEKLSKALGDLDRVESKIKAVDNSRSSGGTSGRWTGEHQAVLKSTQLLNRYEIQIDKLAGKQTELKKLNQQLSQQKP